jgi:hypothetical protein
MHRRRRRHQVGFASDSCRHSSHVILCGTRSSKVGSNRSTANALS